MSLFLFQQKIPFQSVISYLKCCEPSCETPAADWAKEHARDMQAGDIVVLLDPIYSPWGDSSSGIGVSEGDSFKVLQMALVVAEQDGSLMCYSVTPDLFERHKVDDFLAIQVDAARSNGNGFYYSILRCKDGLSESAREAVSQLMNYGNTGWRSAEAEGVDLPMAFLQATGLPVETRQGQLLDISQFGYAIFCDKEPADGTNLPDLRGYLAFVEARKNETETAKTEEQANLDQGPVSLDSPADALVAHPPETTVEERSVPKMPSFFKKPNAGGARPPAPPAIKMPGAESAKRAGQGKPAIIPPAPKGTAAPPPPPAPRVAEIEVVAQQSASAEEPRHLVETNTETSSKPAPPAAELRDGETPPLQQNIADLAAELPRPGQPVPPPNAIHRPPVPGLGIGVAPPLPTGSVPPAPAPAITPPPSSMGSAPLPAAPMPVAETLSPNLPKPGSAPIPPMPPSLGGDSAAESHADNGSPDEPALPFVGAQPSSATKPKHAPIPPVIRPQPPEPVAEKQEEKLEPKTEEREESVVTPDMVAHSGKSVSKAQELQNRQLKEANTVKSGVAGLVSKLELQASKASSRLEAQVDEIQSRLSKEMDSLLHTIHTSEQRSDKSAEGLRNNLIGQMERATQEVKAGVNEAASKGISKSKEQQETGKNAIDEKHEVLRSSLNESFEDLRARAETIARTFEENLNAQSKKSHVELEELRESLRKQLTGTQELYEKALQTSLDEFRERFGTATQSVSPGIESRHLFLESELADLQRRSLAHLEQTKEHLVNTLSKQFVMTETEISKLQASCLQEQILPKLQQHREELRVITTEFQNKLADDLEKKGESKLEEFAPVLEEKKAKLLDLLNETTKIKDQLQDQLKGKLDDIYAELKQFVERSIEKTQTCYKSTEDQLGEIDRAVRGLADPSSIESDMQLLNERNQVLSQLDEATEKAKDEVLTTLKNHVSALEEKGKQLQEALISGMEEDAHNVRRTSEQALASIRESIRESFVAIQTAQDERMPM